jgi:hypothetical protein
MTAIVKQRVSTTAVVLLLLLAICTGWLAIPAIILLVQLATGRYGRLLRAITGRKGPAVA